MKNNFLTIILIFVMYNVVIAQNNSGWHLISPLPQPEWLFDVEVINHDTVFAVGNNGTIIRSTNRGFTWRVNQKILGIETRLYSVCFTDELTGWVVGHGGILLKTNDAGKNWSKIELNLSDEDDLYSVYFLDKNTGWIGGWPGILLKTSDGGINWELQDPNFLGYIYDIRFINETTGYYLGTGGETWIYKSTDGGTTWNLKYQSTGDISSTDFHFVNEYNGWAAGESGVVIKTDDGGETWTEMTISGPQGNHFESIYFIDELTGWVAGRRGRIYKTDNGGDTWNQQSIGLDFEDILKINFINPDTGWLVGESGLIYYTRNGGNSWWRKSSDIRANFDIQFITDTSAIIVSYERIQKTYNKGLSWSTKFNKSNSVINSCDFINDIEGWACGHEIGDNFQFSAFILKTEDGGETWEETISFNEYSTCNDISFINELTGYLLIGHGVRKTTDGGYTWENKSITSPKSTYLYQLEFINEDVGYVTGSTDNGGVIFKTLDGGLNWEENLFSDVSSIRSLNILDNNRIFTGSISGHIIKTMDAGENWEILPFPEQFGISNMYFVNENKGWVLGTHTNGIRIVKKTQDGGLSWTSQLVTNYSYPLKMEFMNDDIGLLVGEGGKIFRTLSGGEINDIIYGQTLYGSYNHLKKNIDIQLYNTESWPWQLNNQTTSDEQGYYQFDNLAQGDYYLTLNNPNGYYYYIYDNLWNYKSGHINYISGENIQRNIRMYKRIKIIEPEETDIIVSIPLQISWEETPFAEYYRVYIYRFENNKYTYISNYYTEDLNYLLEAIPDGQYGKIYLRINAYDTYNRYLGYGSRFLYIYDQSSIVGGIINSNITWQGLILVKEDVTLQNNSTLTILPNTVIFFDTLNTSNQPDRFQINIEGTLKAEGTFDNNIIFRSYGEIELNDPKQWDGLKFINNQNYSQISFNQFMHCSEALAITNSNIAEIKYSRFIKNTTALSLGLNNTSFKECYFNNYYDQSSYIKIQNESDPIFNECYFYPYNKNGNFLIELINSSQDIDATNCYWSYSQYNLDDLIFDKKDNSSLGEVNYIPFLIDPPDLSPGAEEVILDTKIDDPQENLHYVLGIPDNHKYFLNAGTDIILDMGNNSLVKNADSTDFKVYANEYKTSDSSQILIIVALSNDIEGNWEVCGIIQGESSFDIDELGSYSYRYIKISNHSINPTPNDSVGAFIDAVISTNYNYSPLGIDEYNGNYIKGNKTNYIVINPNPVRNTAKISILAPNTGNMEISLISLSGIKIKTLVSKYIKDGIHDMDIDLHNIPAGLYIINLVIDNKLIEAEKIIIY